MKANEQLARIVAVVIARNQAISQADRTMMIMFDGVEAALDRLYGETLFSRDEALEYARVEVARWRDQGINVVSVLDADYPKKLATIHQAPALMFYEGCLRPVDDGVAIVGSREITPRQLEKVRAVTQCVVEHGLTVVSGLALGVDAAAHWEALRLRMRTVAVMGTPIDRTYPRENAALREELCAKGGMVLSQFLPGSSVGRFAFPLRNVTMSGYAQCTVIVAATEKSGTRHQALAAHRHGRPVIILDEVLRNATWAQKLADRPGVFVVASRQELDSVLTSLEHDRELLSSAIPAGV